jgi:hypothetical protein
LELLGHGVAARSQTQLDERIRLAARQILSFALCP